MGGRPLNSPIVAMADTGRPTVRPLGADGWHLHLRRRAVLRSTGGLRRKIPRARSCDDPERSGYWFVASDGVASSRSAKHASTARWAVGRSMRPWSDGRDPTEAATGGGTETWCVLLRRALPRQRGAARRGRRGSAIRLRASSTGGGYYIEGRDGCGVRLRRRAVPRRRARDEP